MWFHMANKTYIELELGESDEKKAKQQMCKQMCVL